MADRLSWLELCLLGIVGQPDKYPMPNHEPRRSMVWKAHTVRTQLARMPDMGGELMTYRAVMHDDGMERFDLTMNGVALVNEGNLVTGLMCLRSIPPDELDPIYDLLTSSQWDAPGQEATPAS